MRVREKVILMAGFTSALALGAVPVLALIAVSSVTAWPKSWPAEFNEYLHSALHVSAMTGGPSEEIYNIHFSDRDEFERLWPAVLKLKTKGAPLTLRTFKPIVVDDQTTADFYTKPYLTILVPPSNPPRKIEIERLSSGEPAEYVQLYEEGWRPIEPGESTSSGYCARARIDVVLYVDGSVIDLNRIPLPGNTPIVDKRALAG